MAIPCYSTIITIRHRQRIQLGPVEGSGSNNGLEGLETTRSSSAERHAEHIMVSF